MNPEPDCGDCDHPARWHLKHAPQRSNQKKIVRGRCIVKVKNERGFPVTCDCKSYRAPRARVKV
jgi:hypothetical protein